MFIDAELQPSTTYSYQVSAFVDDETVSAFSNTATASTPATGVDGGDPCVSVPGGPSTSEYEVVEFATKYLRDDAGAFGVSDEYAYRLVLRNPSQTDHSYHVEAVFRGSDGFVVQREWITDCSLCSAKWFDVPAGQTRMFESTFTLLASFDPSSVTIEVAITVVK